ncbi:hypothetical protein ACMD2_24363 [Ananas comosus]|uniref:Uncharacterized protein n=1 Tax=Ananas comosus TaxID=4615 RepID=A0A199VYA1_ANACO|nr:hypothetical protein ACMD2_24363 [Ananas comosus]
MAMLTGRRWRSSHVFVRREGRRSTTTNATTSRGSVQERGEDPDAELLMMDCSIDSTLPRRPELAVPRGKLCPFGGLLTAPSPGVRVTSSTSLKEASISLLPSGSSRCISRTACGSLILHDEDDNMWQQRLEEPKFDALSVVNEHLDVVLCRPHPVYVDKSRRRYLVSSDLIGHPLFRVLIERSGEGEGMSSAVIDRYEVVLLEHLLRMLRNGDVHPELTPDNFVDFFTLDLAAASTLS